MFIRGSKPLVITLHFIRAYARLPRRIRGWHGVLAVTGVAILVGGSFLLRKAAGYEPPSGPPYISLADERLEVIYAGTSHVGYGIDPRLYRLEGLNLTAGALNYECMEILLRRYLDRSPNLRLLVIEAGIVPLRVNTMARLAGDYRSLYRLGLDVLDLPLNPYRKGKQWLKESWLFYPVYFLDRWSPSRLVWGTRPLGGEGEGRLDTRGHSMLDRVISPRNDGRVVVEHHRLDHLAEDHSAVNLPALLRILAMAERRGLPVVFIRMPHHRTYVEHRPEAWEDQVQGMLARVRAAMPADRLLYLDWETRSELQDEDFADGDHLNTAGVRVLRDILDPVLEAHAAHPGEAVDHAP